MATHYRFREILYMVEGPPERDGMVCTTGWRKTLQDAVNRARAFPEGINREKCTVVKKTTTTTIEKFTWRMASCPKCIG